jgi:hypothetical protein
MINVVSIADFVPERSLIRPFADPINGRHVAQGLVRAVQVIVLHPNTKLVLDILGFGINRRPKLLRHSPLDPFLLAIQLGRTWLDGAKLYSPVHQSTLNRLGKALCPSIRLNALDRKLHLHQHPVENPNVAAAETRRAKPSTR